MSFWQAILLGILQGLTEFLPISSSGHLALGQQFLDLGEVPIVFDLTLHAGTLLSVLIYFRRQLFEMLRSLWTPAMRDERRLIWLLFLGTLPIVVAGFTLKDPLEQVKHHPAAVSALLCVTGVMLLLPQWLARPTESGHSVRSALVMGVGQAFALLPGISRSGSTITAGLLAGVRPGLAAEFSFLLAVPAITGAIVLKADDLGNIPTSDLGPYLAGAFAAFLTGLFAVYAVLSLIRRGKFRYFGFYCLAIGTAGLVYFLALR